MDADVAQRERNNNKYYTSAFIYIQTSRKFANFMPCVWENVI